MVQSVSQHTTTRLPLLKAVHNSCCGFMNSCPQKVYHSGGRILVFGFIGKQQMGAV